MGCCCRDVLYYPCFGFGILTSTVFLAIATLLFCMMVMGTLTFVQIDAIILVICARDPMSILCALRIIVWIVLMIPIIAIVFSHAYYMIVALKMSASLFSIGGFKKTRFLLEKYREDYRPIRSIVIFPTCVLGIVLVLHSVLELSLLLDCVLIGLIYILVYNAKTWFLLILHSWNSLPVTSRCCKLTTARCRRECTLDRILSAVHENERLLTEEIDATDEEREEKQNDTLAHMSQWMNISRLRWQYIYVLGNDFLVTNDDPNLWNSASVKKLNKRSIIGAAVFVICIDLVAWMQGVEELSYLGMLRLAIMISLIPIIGNLSVIKCLYILYTTLGNKSIYYLQGYNVKKEQWVSMVAAILWSAVTLGILVLARIAFAIFKGYTFYDMPDMTNYVATLDHIPTLIAPSDPAPFCSTKIGSHSILKLAALSLIPNIPQDLRNEVIEELFSDDSVKLIEEDNENTTLVRVMVGNAIVNAFPSLDNKKEDLVDFGYMLENTAITYIRNVVKALPFASFVYDYMGDSLDHLIINTYNALIQQTISQNVTASLYKVLKDKVNMGSVSVGHAVGGLIAKYTSLQFDIPSVSFEAPKVVDLATQTLFRFNNSAKYNIYNFWSGLSIFSSEDDKAAANMKLPDLQSYLSPSNVYQTFCLIAAGCTSTTVYDNFCNYTVGTDTYLSYFELWNRQRVVL